MSDSIREQILQALVTRLEEITLANGYSVDLTGAIHRARRFSRESHLPFLTIWDQKESASAEYDALQLTMGVEIELFADHGEENPSAVVNRLLADLMRSLTGGDNTLGGLAEDLIYTGSESIYSEDATTFCGVQVSLDVSYAIQPGDPFSKPD
ncbi:MAG: hypothetical protein HQL53_14370 [Magnetococcales bacterium]|nr:hypothetical protein [Magnetococcales bacterium]